MTTTMVWEKATVQAIDHRGHYMNGLSALQDELSERHRMAAARYRRLEKINHPCADDQLLFCDLLTRLKWVVRDAQTTVALSAGERDA